MPELNLLPNGKLIGYHEKTYPLLKSGSKVYNKPLFRRYRVRINDNYRNSEGAA